jgi:hypothetical protein
MKKFILFLLTIIIVDAQELNPSERINSAVLAIELTDGHSLSNRELQTLSSDVASISEIEEVIYSPNTQIITLKLMDNQTKFSYISELIKHIQGFLNSRTYVFKTPEHAMEVYVKYHHPQANIDKIKIK